MPEVSVIMGVYQEWNRSYVVAAIDSILGQTFRDLEFIICDDGSADEFYQWLFGYCQKDKRLRLFRNSRNRGLAYTLNRCLRHAGGRYIARMDADDISMPDRLEKQYQFLESHTEYAFVGCNARLMDAGGVWGIRQMESRPGRHSFLKTSPFIHPAVMICAGPLRKSGGYSQARAILRTEDYELFMRLYARGYRGYNLQENLFCYREEWQSYKKRKYRYRCRECLVRYHGFSELGILDGNFRYVLKPLFAGLVPSWLMQAYRRKHYKIKKLDR